MLSDTRERVSASGQESVAFFIAKSRYSGYGGDDSFVLELVANWPAPQERLVVIVNSGHPSRDLYAERLRGRAELLVLEEDMTLERRVDQARGGAPLVIRALDASAFRLSRWLRSFKRARSLLRQIGPRALLISDGGYPINDLSWRVLCSARSLSIKTVLVVHNYPGRGTSLISRAIHRLTRRWPLLLASTVVVGSRSLAVALQRYVGGGPLPICVPYGISAQPPPLDSIEPRALFGAPAGRLIGAIANVEERKGLRYLIDAMSEVIRAVPDAAAAIIGLAFDEQLDTELRRRVGELGLAEKVVMPGFIPGVHRYIGAFEIVVIPSLLENFPIVALDAMRAGRPVVATAAGGLPEVISDGETGVLVPPRDAHALASAIIGLLRSPEASRRLGEAGRRRFLRRFTIREMAARYYALMSAPRHGRADADRT